ncbi:MULTISPECIES: 4'-phosphopantetheinyl transferase family protein [unclassified Amycolatopsis]|uniref:4'-phosphopantetheinyl transferase family protein n=1 Tax=unclassified Amycolatopsis TaxID=2618356 RepID=UPI002E0EAB8E|nr:MULTISPECIES: 4'-phosphopantetheinyl transferase superfamily protein [unclassified Amycolatopsis]WSJ74293.1 4'-phosphopantetheinyl transferase superfamily protein [Amycolatopsis sp. NBC_01307]WSK82059.1 4'-phosphopantetheinyl transferase superfamily protein [Amycolatopsis sp. NBC_01286]
MEIVVRWSAPLPAEPRFLRLLDDVEQDRFGAYRQDADKRRFLTGRVLAKTVTAERLGIPLESVKFDATCDDCGKPHGRPRIPGADLTLSISHSGDLIGLAATPAVPVGLDVETATRKADEGLIEYALSPAEAQHLTGLSGEEKARAFFVYWTRKEAVMKATGKGLKIPLQSITFSRYDEPARLLASGDPALDPARTSLTDLKAADGYRAAIAVLTTEELSVTEEHWVP